MKNIIIITVGAIIASIILASGIKQVKQADYLTVNGSAFKVVESDIAKWTIVLNQTVGSSDLKAGSEAISKDQKIIQDYMKASGITENEITIQPLAVQPQYSYQAPIGASPLSGYILSQSIVVESKNVDSVTKASQNATSLISKGSSFSSQPVEYYYSKLAEIKPELLNEAAKDAKARADSLASATSARVGELKSASQGVIQITAENSTDSSDYGYYDTQSKKKKVTAVIKANFELK